MNNLFFVFQNSSTRFFMNFAGLPPTTVQGSTFFVTTAPAAIIAPSPIVTPGRTIARAPIHTPSQIFIGAVTNGRFGFVMSWLAVQIKVSREIATFVPIFILSTEYRYTLSSTATCYLFPDSTVPKPLLMDKMRLRHQSSFQTMTAKTP